MKVLHYDLLVVKFNLYILIVYYQERIVNVQIMYAIHKISGCKSLWYAN